MNIFQKLYYFFSEYVNPDERQIGKYFVKLNENSSSAKIKESLHYYLQKDIVVFNLWCESKYKGYKYLTKSCRRNLFNNVDKIVVDFEIFCHEHEFIFDEIVVEIRKYYPDFNAGASDIEKLKYLRAIMAYMSPANNRYAYRQSSTFGELLKDPKTSQLVGDCNQIVTFYIYLYSLRFDISDLQLITYPGHVALHFRGVDIEATNGKFAHYNDKPVSVLPVHEIASINLLDVTDSYYKTYRVSSSKLLESARLAHIISSQKQIVASNLKSAYHNAVIEYIKSNDYKSALLVAKQSGDKSLLDYVSKHAVKYYIGKNNFKEANRCSKNIQDGDDWQKLIDTNEALYFYNNKQYQKSLTRYKHLKDNAMIKNCYLALYRAEQQKLGELKTVDDIRKHRGTIQKMSTYAKLSGDATSIKYTQELQKYSKLNS